MVGAYEFGYQFGCLVQSKKPGTAAAKGSRKLVKCLVCGEIFDSSIEICPVCGVGRENFVPVEDAANDFTNNTANDYLILGNGAAGFNAAKASGRGMPQGGLSWYPRSPIRPTTVPC